MKNKRLLAILIVFVVIGTFAILGSAVFAVKKINITFTNEFDFFDSSQETQLVERLKESISFVKGKNIITGINRTKITKAIENEETRVRVYNIEAHFPNRIEIRVRERYPVYIYQTGSGSTEKTAVLDGDLRVLDKKQPSKTRWSLINITDEIGTIDFDGINVGDYIAEGETETERTQILKTLSSFYAQIGSYEDAFCTFFQKIEFNDLHGLTLILTSRPPIGSSSLKNYYEVHIWSASSRLTDKLTKAWLMVESTSTKPGTYIVYEDAEFQDGLFGGFQVWS